MRVFFIDPSDTYLGRRAAPSKVAPLLGMAQVAAFARSQGHDVRVYDAMIESEVGPELRTALLDFEPDVVGLTATTPFIPVCFETARRVRHWLPEARIVLGGCHASAVPDACFRECACLDYVVVGEGELSFSHLLEALDGRPGPKGCTVSGIAGVLGRHEPAAAVQARPLQRCLDQLPTPDWSMYRYDAYQRIYSRRLGCNERLFQVLLSRGCPSRCSFCYRPFGASYRVRSSTSVRDEMEQAFHLHRARLFDFLDPTMTYRARRFQEFCRVLRESPWCSDIAWTFETRPDSIDEDLLGAAQAAGCESLLLGVESGSQTILDAMGKGTTVDQNLAAIRAAARVGLHVRATLIVGHPYESTETLRETVRFVRRAKKTGSVEFLPAFLGVYPGTRVYGMVERGEGGARWAPGVRGNWQRARRDQPMIEVGALDTAALLARMQALQSLVRDETSTTCPPSSSARPSHVPGPDPAPNTT
jgi:anaerobic magnesium-protoporphyrin IX monomethyl ester cyclase